MDREGSESSRLNEDRRREASSRRYSGRGTQRMARTKDDDEGRGGSPKFPPLPSAHRCVQNGKRDPFRHMSANPDQQPDDADELFLETLNEMDAEAQIVPVVLRPRPFSVAGTKANLRQVRVPEGHYSSLSRYGSPGLKSG
jgi:hypothetical protein